jgi:hypothetical protein
MIEKLKKKIVYLAHPYSNDPERSHSFATIWKLQLMKMGFNIFSPITHTHNVAKYCLALGKKEPNWIKEDLAMIKGLMKNDANVWHCPENDCDCPLDDEFYCPVCEISHAWNKNEMKEEYPDAFRKYDSGIFMVLSNTAYGTNEKFRGEVILSSLYDTWQGCFSEKGTIDKFSQEYWENAWKSQGCRQEYEFAKKNYIQIFELEAFLKGRLKEL